MCSSFYTRRGHLFVCCSTLILSLIFKIVHVEAYVKRVYIYIGSRSYSLYLVVLKSMLLWDIIK